MKRSSPKKSLESHHENNNSQFRNNDFKEQLLKLKDNAESEIKTHHIYKNVSDKVPHKLRDINLVKRQHIKTSKDSLLIRSVNAIISHGTPKAFKRESWCSKHNDKSKFAIFAVLVDEIMKPRDAKYFLGTARKVGFDGDIVIAINSATSKEVVNIFKQYKSIVYSISLAPDKRYGENVYYLYNGTQTHPINLMRFHFYKWWSMMYSSNTYIMLSDMRDVFFQSDPFNYQYRLWTPPKAQLVVFLEAYPRGIINNCRYNKGWIRRCYGQNAVERIGHNNISITGIVMGTRNAILVYSSILLNQTAHKTRLQYGANKYENIQKYCKSTGMDQAFHNWILYTGILEKYMKIRIFPQGEGPVNTVGYLTQDDIEPSSIKTILRGQPPHAVIVNNNADPSPVVHQLDTFIKMPLFDSTYVGVLEAMEGLFDANTKK